MLKFVDVRKRYGTFELACNMEVKPGMVTGLIGANGAGKSTAFKAALDLISIDGGTIELFGKPHKEIMAEDKERLGIVLAESGFSEYFTILDIASILDGMYRKFSREKFLKKCEEFGLPLKKKVKEFSMGMKAKLKLLVAMSHEAELLILDEPTAGLDVTAREEVLSILQDYLAESDTRSVLISSHISTDLEKFCDDIYMIQAGKIMLHEETGTLMDAYGIAKVSEKQYGELDRCALLRRKKEAFGYSLLVNDRQFYAENYPEIVMEKCSIDDVILMMTKGEEIC